MARLSEIIDAERLTEVVAKEMNIGVTPQFIGREEFCLNKLLKKRKFQYNSDLNGILIRYSDLEILSETGRIIDDNPLVFWRIRAKFHVFNVHPGQILKSFVNRIGTRYIGCSLANCIDVTIKFHEELEASVPERICNALSVGDPITFKVKVFVPSQRFIEGVIDQEICDILSTSGQPNSAVD